MRGEPSVTGEPPVTGEPSVTGEPPGAGAPGAGGMVDERTVVSVDEVLPPGASRPSVALARRDPHDGGGLSGGGPVRWWSRRVVLLDLALLFVFPLCLLAAWWQIGRALGGNTLSWVYCFEWPFFAGLSVWGWWQLVHAVTAPQMAPPASGARPVTWDLADESDELRQYNALLARLSEPGRPALPPGRAARRALR